MTKNAATTGGGWKPIALAMLFWLPLISGVADKLFEQRKWFRDYGAVACAAQKHLLGEPIYARDLSCPDIPAVMYIYHPWVAEAFSWPLAALGPQGLFMAYAGLYAAMLAGLLWIIVGRGAPGLRGKRSWFAAFLTGSAVYWANIAVILHGLIGLFAIGLRKRALLLVPVVALAVFVKPLFAGFAMVFLLMRRGLLARIVYAAAAVGLGLAPSLWLFWQGGELAEQWRELLEYAIYEDRPGDGYLGWVAALGGDVASFNVKLGYLGYGGVMALAGLVLAEGLELDDEARALLGLSLGVLLIPRIMSQDFWLLGPGLIALAGAAGLRAAAAGRWLERALLGFCIVALIGNLADLSEITTRLALAGLALCVICAAIWTLGPGRANIAAMWTNLLRGAPAPAGA